MTGKELAQVLNKFLTSPHAQWARVQIELPNGEKLHQISFHMKHNLNTFILVSCPPDKGKVRLYPGSSILELVRLGLQLEPLVQAWELVTQKLESL
jgi:hypothetical protein